LRHRTEKFIEGHIKHCGEPALKLMQVGYSQAKLKPGTIGVKVVIMPPDAKLPDEIEVMPAVVEPIAKEEEATPEGEETAPADDKQASVAEAPPEEGAQPDADASKEAAKASDGGKKADAAEAPEEVTQPEAKAEDSG
ncbi:MAG: 30S ribosomal protein S3, partial [Candidatus Thermoplasmatota archaeon]|nr:30S ribosomal protein S3 [Candidatus Thermoplasmatota archaeon]